MCGIVGYIGDKDALPVIISGLEKLEYRGYDSAGVAVVESGGVSVTRSLGKLAALKQALEGKQRNGGASLGIGHTRWATHGRPSENNAHPHCAGRVSLIHNGIIENYLDLRGELEKQQCEFKSETDTEIAAHLLAKQLETGAEPFDALRACCGRIRGSYAFVAMDSERPDRLLVAKNSTPIIIGVGEGEMLVASDIPAVLPHTRRIIVLEDGDLAEVTRTDIRVENAGRPVQREIQTITWDPVTAQKGGFNHFMLKEIHEQPQAVTETFRGRVQLGKKAVSLEELELSDADLRSIERVLLIACGTAWHACLVAKFYFESLAKIPCEVDYASEFRYRQALYDEKTLVVAVSQSGETADTLAAVDLVLRPAAGKPARTAAVCNVLGSSLTRKVRNVVYTHAGPEISVASTKAFSTQLLALLLLAMHVAEKRKSSAAQIEALMDPLLALPSAMEETLHCAPRVEQLAKEFYNASDFLYLGRGVCYPIALEGALKLKEISYIHAEGYPAGEMKHGPIALVDENLPVVVLVHKSSVLLEKTISNLKEVEARRGRIIAITDIPEHSELTKIASGVIEVPYLHELLSPMLHVLPLQLLAYYVAVLNGADVDLPRNLAKSVTVE